MVLPEFLVDIIIPILILYYGYMSFKAIESTNKDDDTQWLTFWLLYSVIVFAEIWSDIFLSWIPFYSEAKIGLIVYLGIFKGASQVYTIIVRPTLLQHEKDIDKQIDHLQKQGEKYQKLAEKLAKEKTAELGKLATSSLAKGLQASK